MTPKEEQTLEALQKNKNRIDNVKHQLGHAEFVAIVRGTSYHPNIQIPTQHVAGLKIKPGTTLKVKIERSGGK